MVIKELIFPKSIHVDHNSTHWWITGISDLVDVKDATQKMQRIQVEVVPIDPLHEQTRECISSSDVMNCLNIGKNDEAQVVHVDEAVKDSQCDVEEQYWTKAMVNTRVI